MTQNSSSTGAVDAAHAENTEDDHAAAPPAEESAVNSEERMSGSGTTIQRLEEEGDVAADYLEELLDIADLDGDIDIDVEGDRASVSVLADGIEAKSLAVLVGRDGEVLDALQELTRLAAQAKTGERSRLMLDVAGYRAKQRKNLQDVARDAVDQARRSGSSVALEPMNAFERKVVHDVVKEAGFESRSDGADANRHVVIRPESRA